MTKKWLIGILGCISFCLSSCDKNYGKGLGFSNPNAGIRFLVSEDKKVTEIDGFYIDSSLLDKEEWNVEYTLNENDFYWGNAYTRFGKDIIWVDHEDKNKYDYDHWTSSIAHTQFFHFRFLDSNMSSPEQIITSFNVTIITIKIVLVGEKFNDLFFFDSTPECNFIFENSNAQFQNKHLPNYINISQFNFIIKPTQLLIGGNWSKYERCWDGEQYIITSFNRTTEIKESIRVNYGELQIVNHKDTIWNGELNY